MWPDRASAPSTRAPAGAAAAAAAAAAAVVEIPGRLRRAKQAVIAADGTATIQFSPDNAWQRWEVTGVVVQTSQAATATPVPTAEVFVNTTTSAGNSMGKTASGNNDTFAGLAEVGPADNLNIAWAGGIAGTIATAAVTGTYWQRRA